MLYVFRKPKLGGLVSVFVTVFVAMLLAILAAQLIFFAIDEWSDRIASLAW